MLRYSSLPIKRVIPHSNPRTALTVSRLALSRASIIPLFNPSFNRWNSSTSKGPKDDSKTVNEKQESVTKVSPVKEKLPMKAKIQNALRHYWDGSKLLGLEIKISSKLLWKVPPGYPTNEKRKPTIEKNHSRYYQVGSVCCVPYYPICRASSTVCIEAFSPIYFHLLTNRAKNVRTNWKI